MGMKITACLISYAKFTESIASARYSNIVNEYQSKKLLGVKGIISNTFNGCKLGGEIILNLLWSFDIGEQSAE